MLLQGKKQTKTNQAQLTKNNNKKKPFENLTIWK